MLATQPCTTRSADRIHERHGRVMGADLHLLVVDGDEALLDAAVRRLHDLEARWTRFRSDSELSRINAAAGMPVVVSADTLTLVEGLQRAWELTAGRFDPTVHDAVVRAGYAASWPAVDSPGPLAAMPAPGCWGVRLRHDTGLVTLPRGVHLDPGGLGKGLAADLVAADLVAAGARGALVSIGGDLRVMGCPPEGELWWIDIEHPDDRARVIARVALADGGVATSTSARRRWTGADGRELHHLIDPSTGLPAERPWRQATAVAGSAAWAEVAAKVTFLDGEPGDGCSAALVVGPDGGLRTVGDASWFELPG